MERVRRVPPLLESAPARAKEKMRKTAYNAVRGPFGV